MPAQAPLPAVGGATRGPICGRRPIIALLVATLLLALLPPGGRSAVAATTTVLVTPASLQGWEIQNAVCQGDPPGTATVAFVSGPGTPPSGSGSLRLAVGSNGWSFLALHNYGTQFSLALSQIQALTYHTYVSAVGVAAQTPFLVLDVNYSGDASADDQLYFEPGRQDGTYPTAPGDGPLPLQGPPALATWQAWDAKAGGWRSKNDGLANPPLHTLAGYAADHPGATITNTGQGAFGFRIGAGCGSGNWNGFIGHVDKLTLGVGGNSTIFDFETGASPSPSASPGPSPSPSASPSPAPSPGTSPSPGASPSPSPSPSPAPARKTLTATATGNGVVAGSGQYDVGDVAVVTATPDEGHRLTGWTVDGVFQGWATPLTITMDVDHSVVGTFAPDVPFADVPADRPDSQAIAELAARGHIKGYGDGTYGPDNRTLRAQMAALIARPMGYSDGPPNPFTDRCEPLDPANCVDDELWNRVAQLASRAIARGHTDPATCAPSAAPCYAPRDDVLHAQVLSFIARAMVDAGYWTQQPADPTLYGGVLNGSGHEADVATYLFYTQAQGGVPDYPATGAFPAWDQPATRGWFARALWAALDSHWGMDRVP